ncbi:MAG: hypothetical protein ACRDTN_04295 [Mycobacterium sp.]
MNRPQNRRRAAVIGVSALGGLAAAALAMAPFASADPTDITTTVQDEVAQANAFFDFEAALAGVTDDVDKAGGPNGFDIINPADVTKVQDNDTTPFDYLVYGVNPTAAGLASDPGAYNVGNGSLIEFDDAYNSVVYGFLNGNDTVIPADDLFGSQSVINTALATGSDFGAAGVFFDAGLADLAAYGGF